MSHSADQPIPRTAEGFSDFVAAQLQSHGERLDAIEVQIAEVVEIIRLGKGFFRTCAWLGRGVKWAGGIAAAGLAIWQAIEHLIRGTPGQGGGS